MLSVSLHLRAAALILSLAPATFAQGNSNSFVGLTRGKGPFTKGVQLVTQNMGSCKVTVSLKINENGAWTLGNSLHHAGAAYDPVRRGLWITNGSELHCVDPASGKVLCRNAQLPVTPRRKLSPFSITASALAFDNKNNTLFLADVVNGDIYRVPLGSAADPRACAYSSSYASVAKHIPSFHWVSGMAVDQVRRLLFVGSFHQTKGTRHIYVTTLDKWDQKMKDVVGKGGKLPACPNGTTSANWMQGMAFDSARGLLYVTDGITTTAYSYDHSKFELTAVSCCKNPGSKTEDKFGALALVPDGAITRGTSCSTRPCEACNTMQLQAVGDPVLGNPHFGLRLSGAPDSASSAIAAIGLGPCTTPGVKLGYCTPVTVSLNLWQVASVSLKNARNCGTTASLSAPVPADRGVFGARLSCQFLMLCGSGARLGHALTNCVGVQIGRN